MLSGKVSKIFRRNSNRRRKEVPRPPTSDGTPLSPVIERASIGTSEIIRPVPPPHHHSSQQFSHHGSHYEDYPEELIEPQSRLYETFSASEAGSRHPAAHSVRDDDGLPSHRRYGSYGTVHSERGAHEPTILISPSVRSHSSHESSQRVAFAGAGNPGTHASTSAGVPRGVVSLSSRGDRAQPVPVMASTHRSDYTYPTQPTYTRQRQAPRRHASAPVAMPRAPTHQGDVIRQRLPYMIFVDDGHGLEIGNDVDGFMPYEEYLATAHLRETPMRDTYYVIPGSTVVEFHDESGRVLWRVDGRKYLTPTLRRRKYVIQDEYGRELFRIGNFKNRSSSGSKAPKVMYLNPESSSPFPQNTYNSFSRTPSSQTRSTTNHSRQMHYEPVPFSRGTLFEDARSISTVSSAPGIVVVNEEGEQVYDSRSNNQDQPSQHSVFISPRSRFANELIDRDTNANASTASATSTVMSDSHYDRDYDHDYDHAHNHGRDVYIDPEGTPVVVRSDRTAGTSRSSGTSSSSSDSLYSSHRQHHARRR
ncbi:hypothetical protein PNOK_0369700 [Pyrrhoderma noxium]|uniref:Uncharacterized protein n=1 Tax=Pyrrhoderma noxium TaxID=2282107 RepID=A0A286UND0_9AGAM|nr:hypothetical protein PNOK_0369700 [Pyrrhoderma noxium]